MGALAYTSRYVFVDCSWNTNISISCLSWWPICYKTQNTLAGVPFLTDPWRICSSNSRSHEQIPWLLMGAWASNSTRELKVGFLTFYSLAVELIWSWQKFLTLFSAMILNVHTITASWTPYGFLTHPCPPQHALFSVLSVSVTCYTDIPLVVKSVEGDGFPLHIPTNKQMIFPDCGLSFIFSFCYKFQLRCNLPFNWVDGQSKYRFIYAIYSLTLRTFWFLYILSCTPHTEDVLIDGMSILDIKGVLCKTFSE